MTVLVTGFEPYGGHAVNPSERLARSLDGAVVAGAQVEARQLAVDLRTIGPSVRAAIEETEPRLVVGLGLWPGEPMLRLERIAVNQADFEVPDNAGLVACAPLVQDGPAARPSTLPLHAISESLLAAGIPCRLSGTAGLYLCNAMLYHALEACAARRPAPLAGFIHVPYLPEQVADLARTTRARHGLGLGQRADLASMSLDVMHAGVCLAIQTALEAATV